MKASKTPSPFLAGGCAWYRLGLMLLLGPQTLSWCQVAGTVTAWGANNALQCQVPTGVINVVAVAGGDAHSLALKSDATVAGWGFNINGQATPPAGLSNVVAIAAGHSYSMALKADGTVVVWGLQAAPPSGLTNVIAIAAGWDHCLALKSDRTVVGWGNNTAGQTNVPAGLSDVVAIAAGDQVSLALQSNGSILGWGDDSFGKIEVPANLSNVVAIAAGQDHCLALMSSGIVVAWGGDYDGQASVPASLTNAVAISAGAVHSLAMRMDGTLVAWGDNTYGQAVVNPTQQGYFAIAAGGYHNLALHSYGLPTILSQPASQTVGTFSTVTFQVIAVGTPPLAFRWLKDGANLTGATDQVLVLPSVRTNDTGTYTVVVSNAFGTVTSIGAVLTAEPVGPSFAVQPKDQTAFCGEPASFQVSVKGSVPLSYQWLFQGAPIDAATDSILALSAVTTNQAGGYSVIVTNQYGSATSAVANLTVILEPPRVTSPLSASAKQGQPFSYTITAQHDPTSFSALFLPAGLVIDPATGIISGIPQASGVFGPTITAANACASDSQTLALDIASSVPSITSALTISGVQGSPLTYQIRATELPTAYGAQNLPVALSVNPATGIISGTPAYPGTFDSTISASNAWGVGTATLHFSFSALAVTNLAIANVSYNYSSPYLLDFQFSLRDSDDPTMGNPVVVDPKNLVVNGFEDDEMVSTNETSVIIHGGADRGANSKVVKAYLVLDFTESIASLVNGDANGNGISDAVDFMVSGAQSFVNQQPSTTQIGVYEFHREDLSPSNVVALTTDKALVDTAIAGIWTNYVQGFSAGSRCWDALVAAIKDLGPTNSDEQHFIVFVSDGRDESSLKTTNDVINAATNAHVAIYCIGFGADLDTNALQSITSGTLGRYYTAANAADLANQFAQIGKDFNAQYVLRWATLKRSSLKFMPSFTVSYNGLTATSPPNPWYVDTNNPIIDTNSTPPTTNYNNVTNFIIDYFAPNQHTGDVTAGLLRLAPNADVRPTGLTLRTTYVPRNTRQLRLHYRANWPCTTSFQATNAGDLMPGRSLIQTNDGAGGVWALFSGPTNNNSNLVFANFGDVLNFNFRDAFNGSNAFSVLEVDNTLYTNTGKQSFTFSNLNSFITLYPVLPFGTPVPWLIAHGFANNFTNAETSDVDGDGMLTWQEYQANTDPRDKNSRFVIRSVTTGDDGRNQITFSTALNRNYRVDWSADLVTWQTVQDGIVGTGFDNTVIDPQVQIGVPQLFYRVRVY